MVHGVQYRTRQISGEKFYNYLNLTGHKPCIHGVHGEAGHMGSDRSLELLQQRFYWPGMVKQLEEHTQNCGKCI